MLTNSQFVCRIRRAAFLAAVVFAGAFATRLEAQTTEKELLAVLRSDAPAADKAITCKRLAIHGTSEAVPDLAKLLADPQLSSWARIALEAIPGPVADEALRKAAESLQGELAIGTINSIGFRRDAAAADLLAARLQDQNVDVACAAAVALGKIGNAPATKTLRDALAATSGKLRSAVAEGCVLTAEGLLLAGKATEATEIYDQVRNADVPKQRIIEATRGAILARGDAGIPLLQEQLQSPDKGLFRLALGTAREIPGGAVDQALAAELAKAAPERAALIVQAMADRPATVDLAAVLKAAGSGATPVRLSAIKALERVGNESCLATLLAVALDADPELSQAAKQTLGKLPGDGVNEQIAAQLAQAEGKHYALLIELVGQRRVSAVPLLLKAVDNSDAAIRGAALTALGQTVALKELPVLIASAVSPKRAEDGPAALRALQAAAIRMPDREACAGELTAAVDKSSSVATKSALLEILGAMGGTKALAAMAAAARGNNPDLQDVSTRLLGEWMTEDAAPVLLDLTKSAPGEKFQVRALRGYIRIARQFVLPEPQRAEMCAQAFAAARLPTEKKMVLDVLKRYPNADTLKLAVQALRTPEVKTEATEAVLVIAQKVGGPNVAEALSQAGIERVKLEIVKAEYGGGSTQVDVTAILRRQVSDLPLITLPKASYNTSFGGDPLPGSVKQLKVQYRLNGKLGEATFAENATIILPPPK